MARNSNLPTGCFAAIFLVVGVGLLIGAVVAEVHRAKAMSGTVRATGVVVAMEQRSEGGGSRPVVEFRTPNENLHVIRGTVYSSPPSFAKGESVVVAYHADKPDEAILVEFWEQHLIALVLGFIGFLFSCFGVAFAWVTSGGWRR